MNNQEMWICLAYFWLMGAAVDIAWILIPPRGKLIDNKDPWYLSIIEILVAFIAIFLGSWILVYIILKENINWRR